MIALLEVRNGVLYEYKGSTPQPFHVRYHGESPYAEDWTIQRCFEALTEKLGHLPLDGKYACGDEEMVAMDWGEVVDGAPPEWDGKTQQ